MVALIGSDGNNLRRREHTVNTGGESLIPLLTFRIPAQERL